jgi:hypothetical protein
MKPGTDSGLHISLPVLVMVVLTTIFILVTGIISVLILDQTYQHLMHEWDNDVRHNEQYLENSLKLINQGLLLFDHTFDASMKEQFGYFIEAYNQSGNDPSLMNLTHLKLQLTHQYEILRTFILLTVLVLSLIPPIRVIWDLILKSGLPCMKTSLIFGTDQCLKQIVQFMDSALQKIRENLRISLLQIISTSLKFPIS